MSSAQYGIEDAHLGAMRLLEEELVRESAHGERVGLWQSFAAA